MKHMDFKGSYWYYIQVHVHVNCHSLLGFTIKVASIGITHIGYSGLFYYHIPDLVIGLGI